MKKTIRALMLALLACLAALLLLGVFGVSILSVLLTGAGTYRRLVQRHQLSYDRRTCAQYVAARVRQAPSPDAVVLSRFGSSDALVIREDVDGTVYLTRVYCHDGWLMELFTVADGAFAPEDGEKILPLQSLSLSRDGTLISIYLTDPDNSSQLLTLHIRGGTAP